MQTPEESGEKTLLVARPVRLMNLRYYVFMVLLLTAAGYLQFFRPSFLPAYSLPGGWDVYFLLELLLVFIALVEVLIAEVRRMLRQYIVTNYRLILVSGIVRKNTTVIMANQIERVFSSQGLLQRLFGYGDVVVDTGEDEIVLASIRNPTKVEGTVTQGMASRWPGRK